MGDSLMVTLVLIERYRRPDSPPSVTQVDETDMMAQIRVCAKKSLSQAGWSCLAPDGTFPLRPAHVESAAIPFSATGGGIGAKTSDSMCQYKKTLRSGAN